ncbi:MAG: hypothetical protein IIB57_00895 [Planctomycetes bacterium]|nr:hypothetical protein [Planctomycetota bacterium]
MKHILFICFLCIVLQASSIYAQALETPGESQPPVDAAAAEAARMELAKGAVELALFTAESRLAEGRWDDAMAMAWVGLEELEKLSLSNERSTLAQSLMQVIVDSRVEKRVAAERKTRAPAKRPDPLSTPSAHRARDAKTGLSTVKPPRNQTPLAEALTRLGEDPGQTEKVVVYPSDWQSTAGRVPDRSGVLFEGVPFENDQGQVVQTVIYDVRSLVLPRLNFQYIPGSDLHSITQSASDREALRRGSEIFNGYADDLAAGIPLLGQFGGVGNWPATFGNGDKEMAELLRIIEGLTAP